MVRTGTPLSMANEVVRGDEGSFPLTTKEAVLATKKTKKPDQVGANGEDWLAVSVQYKQNVSSWRRISDQEQVSSTRMSHEASSDLSVGQGLGPTGEDPGTVKRRPVVTRVKAHAPFEQHLFSKTHILLCSLGKAFLPSSTTSNPCLVCRP